MGVEDLDVYFGEHIEKLASNKGASFYSHIRDEILAWYDGYSWDAKTRVINPYSLLCFFTRMRFSAFWYDSGTPKFLVDLVKENPRICMNLDNLRITESALNSAELDALEAGALLFQTGYLTIKEISHFSDEYIYHLEIPNREVRKAFNVNLIANISGKSQSDVTSTQLDMQEAFQNNDMQKFLDALRGLYASTPYDIHVDLEAYYHSIFYAIMNTLGFNVKAETEVSGGRVDAILEIGDRAYVMEFKHKKCPAKASQKRKRELLEKALEDGMEQIKKRGYANKYIGSGKTVYLVAIAILGRDNIDMRIE